jgi:chromosome segregation ATPase
MDKLPPAPLPEDLESMRIVDLKELGRERGYNDIWRNGTKKADYIAWINAQHAEQIRAAQPNPLNALVDRMREQREHIREQKEYITQKQLEISAKKECLLTVIAMLDSKENKTIEEYEGLVKSLKLLMEYNEVLSKIQNVGSLAGVLV